MARVPFAQRDTMTPEGQEAWDEIESSRGGVARNYAAILNNPQAARYMATLGGYARFETPLDPRVKALAVLTAAREAGIDDAVIAAIHEYRAPAGLDSKDAAVVQFVLELLRQHRVSDATFEGLRSRVGDAGVIDVLVVVAYYHGLAHTLQALDVELPEGVSSALTY